MFGKSKHPSDAPQSAAARRTVEAVKASEPKDWRWARDHQRATERANRLEKEGR